MRYSLMPLEETVPNIYELSVGELAVDYDYITLAPAAAAFRTSTLH